MLDSFSDIRILKMANVEGATPKGLAQSDNPLLRGITERKLVEEQA
jgi:hypothetical protein